MPRRGHRPRIEFHRRKPSRNSTLLAIRWLPPIRSCRGSISSCFSRRVRERAFRQDVAVTMPIPDNANEPEYWRKRAEDARTKASTTLYNGQFPGPMVRLTEGKRVVVDIYNDTDTHWHGQFVPADVDGAAEE